MASKTRGALKRGRCDSSDTTKLKCAVATAGAGAGAGSGSGAGGSSAPVHAQGGVQTTTTTPEGPLKRCRGDDNVPAIDSSVLGVPYAGSFDPFFLEPTAPVVVKRAFMEAFEQRLLERGHTNVGTLVVSKLAAVARLLCAGTQAPDTTSVAGMVKEVMGRLNKVKNYEKYLGALLSVVDVLKLTHWLVGVVHKGLVAPPVGPHSTTPCLEYMDAEAATTLLAVVCSTVRQAALLVACEIPHSGLERVEGPRLATDPVTALAFLLGHAAREEVPLSTPGAGPSSGVSMERQGRTLYKFACGVMQWIVAVNKYTPDIWGCVALNAALARDLTTLFRTECGTVLTCNLLYMFAYLVYRSLNSPLTQTRDGLGQMLCDEATGVLVVNARSLGVAIMSEADPEVKSGLYLVLLTCLQCRPRSTEHFGAFGVLKDAADMILYPGTSVEAGFNLLSAIVLLSGREEFDVSSEASAVFFMQCGVEELVARLVRYFTDNRGRELKRVAALGPGLKPPMSVLWGAHLISRAVHRQANAPESARTLFKGTPQSASPGLVCPRALARMLVSIAKCRCFNNNSVVQDAVLSALFNTMVCSEAATETVGTQNEFLVKVARHALWQQVSEEAHVPDSPANAFLYLGKMNHAFSIMTYLVASRVPRLARAAVAVLVEPPILVRWAECIRGNVAPAAFQGLTTLCSLCVHTDQAPALVAAGVHTAIADLVTTRSTSGKRVDVEDPLEDTANPWHATCSQMRDGLRALMLLCQHKDCSRQIREDLCTNIGLLRALFTVTVDHKMVMNTEEERDKAYCAVLDAEGLYRLIFQRDDPEADVDVGEWFVRVALASVDALPTTGVTRPTCADSGWTPPVCNVCLDEMGGPPGHHEDAEEAVVVRLPCFCLCHRKCLVDYMVKAMLPFGKDCCVGCQQPMLWMMHASWPSRSPVLFSAIEKHELGTLDLNRYKLNTIEVLRCREFTLRVIQGTGGDGEEVGAEDAAGAVPE